MQFLQNSRFGSAQKCPKSTQEYLEGLKKSVNSRALALFFRSCGTISKLINFFANSRQKKNGTENPLKNDTLKIQNGS